MLYTEINLSKKNNQLALESVWKVDELLMFFGELKSEKGSSLKRLKLSFGKFLLHLHTLETFKELDSEHYEHIEQSLEFEEVMEERIEELEKIVEEAQENDEDEFLSFFKGGVPHDKRAFFYENYEESFIDFKQESSSDMSTEHKRGKKFLKATILLDLPDFLNNHEYFTFESNICKMVSMFIKKYTPIICQPNSAEDSILKLPCKNFIKYFGIASFVSLDPAVCFKFFETVYHKVSISVWLEYHIPIGSGHGG